MLKYSSRNPVGLLEINSSAAIQDLIYHSLLPKAPRQFLLRVRVHRRSLPIRSRRRNRPFLPTTLLLLLRSRLSRGPKSSPQMACLLRRHTRPLRCCNELLSRVRSHIFHPALPSEIPPGPRPALQSRHLHMRWYSHKRA